MATCDYVESLGGPCVSVGRRWRDHIAKGRWDLKEVFYWAQPQPFWDMPAEVTADLAQSAMVFVKGDANYRRLLGDCEWELTTPFATVRRVRLCSRRQSEHSETTPRSHPEVAAVAVGH
jgi:hypothetical protein